MSFKKAKIGEHELYYGDCLEVMPTLKDKSIDMIFADLPYGVTARNKWDVIIPFEPLWKQYERIIKDNGAMIFTATEPFSSMLIMSNPKLFRYDLIWEKHKTTGFLNANRMPLRCHESILIFYKKLPTYNPQFTDGKPYINKRDKDDVGSNYNGIEKRITTVNEGKRFPKSVLRFDHDNSKFHPTQKPVALIEYLIESYTNENESILDNTMGSGSTGEAGMNLNRRFIGIEKELEYFKIAHHRLKEVYEKSLSKNVQFAGA